MVGGAMIVVAGNRQSLRVGFGVSSKIISDMTSTSHSCGASAARSGWPVSLGHPRDADHGNARREAKQRREAKAARDREASTRDPCGFG
jgi:hypothetical protein